MDEDVPVAAERGVLAATSIAYAVAGLAAALVVAWLPPEELRAAARLLRSVGQGSFVAAALGLLLLPLALHPRTHGLLRGLPLYGAAGALVISPARVARTLLAPVLAPGGSIPLSLTYGVDACVEWLSVLAPCAALATLVSLGAATGYSARRAAFGVLRGLPQAALGLGIAAAGAFVAARMRALDLRAVIAAADVTLLRANEATLLAYATLLTGLMLAVLSARSSRHTVSDTAVRAAGPALIVGLLLPAFGERAMFELLARRDPLGTNRGSRITLPTVTVPGREHVDPHLTLHGRLHDATLETPDGRSVATRRAPLAAYLTSAFPQDLPPPTQDEGGNVRCAEQSFPRNELVLLADAGVSLDVLRALVGACEDARISTLTFVLRDATVARLGGDSPLVRLIPPVITTSSLLLSPTRESCTTTYGRAAIEPLPYDSLRALAADPRTAASAIDARTPLYTVDDRRSARGRR